MDCIVHGVTKELDTTEQLLLSGPDSENKGKAIPKNAQTTTQLHSSHMLVK